MQGCAQSLGEAPEPVRQVATVPAKNPNAPHTLTNRGSEDGNAKKQRGDLIDSRRATANKPP